MTKFDALVEKHTPLAKALGLMASRPGNKNIPGMVVIVDQNQKVLGVLSDGDIRRGLTKGLTLDSEVWKFANPKPVIIRKNYSTQQARIEIIRQAKERGLPYQVFTKLVVVDDDHRFVDVIWQKEVLDEQIDDKVVAVYGLGYVGLTLAAALASEGLIVIGVDSNQEVLKSLNEGQATFYEKGLDSLLLSLRKKEQLQFKHTSEMINADIHIVAVGSPINHEHQPDLSAIKQVTLQISKRLKKNDLVIYRSTLPVGTTRNIIIPLLNQSGLTVGAEYYLAFAPERTIEGNAIAELFSLPQVIGANDSKSYDLASKVFRKLTNTIVKADNLEGAELVKLINNTYRDLVFSFANEVSHICEHFNINAFKLIQIANEGYPRNPVPQPSPGVGGLCLSKDPYLYSYPAEKLTYKPILGKASREINSNGHTLVKAKLEKYCSLVGKKLDKIKIYIIGLAFKGTPPTSDIRDSTALNLINILPNRKNVYVKDFVVGTEVIKSLEVNGVENILDGFEKADAVLVMNNHYHNNLFTLSSALEKMVKDGLFFDGWDLFNQVEIENFNGLYYATLGYLTPQKK